ncbi:hypothetical protein NNL21_22395 [Paenibacillus mendelii]|nr:hypothetical protein [Paenibacillus mendelii]
MAGKSLIGTGQVVLYHTSYYLRSNTCCRLQHGIMQVIVRIAQ